MYKAPSNVFCQPTDCCDCVSGRLGNVLLITVEMKEFVVWSVRDWMQCNGGRQAVRAAHVCVAAASDVQRHLSRWTNTTSCSPLTLIH